MRVLPIALVAIASLVLPGCASEIMNSYVGKPLVEAVMDYGHPVEAFDVDQETRAFVWTRQVGFRTPSYTTGQASYSGTATAIGRGNVVNASGQGLYSLSALTLPSQDVSWICRYVVFGQRMANGIEGPAGWRVTGFRKPAGGCE